MGNKLCFKIKRSKKPSKDLRAELQIPKIPDKNADTGASDGRFQAEDPVDQDGDLMSKEIGCLSDTTKPTFDCRICFERKLLTDSYNPSGCSHLLCVQCTSLYIRSKLDQNVTRVLCPIEGCVGVLKPESCRDILPSGLFDKWGLGLCESSIDGSQKIYCPYRDCSSLLIDDEGVVIKKSECPNCKRLFCAQCEVAWHEGMECEEFQKLNRTEKGKDIMFLNLAQRKEWRKCPKCRIFVERSEGCPLMTCRCKAEFCYACGRTWSSYGHFCKAT